MAALYSNESALPLLLPMMIISIGRGSVKWKFSFVAEEVAESFSLFSLLCRRNYNVNELINYIEQSLKDTLQSFYLTLNLQEL